MKWRLSNELFDDLVDLQNKHLPFVLYCEEMVRSTWACYTQYPNEDGGETDAYTDCLSPRETLLSRAGFSARVERRFVRRGRRPL